MVIITKPAGLMVVMGLYHLQLLGIILDMGPANERRRRVSLAEPVPKMVPDYVCLWWGTDYAIGSVNNTSNPGSRT